MRSLVAVLTESLILVLDLDIAGAFYAKCYLRCCKEVRACH